MMDSFVKSQNQKRSISLPCRSHPSTDKIEVELSKIKSWESTSSTQNVKKIINSLLGLVDLFKSLEELLNLQVTKQALSHHHCEKFVYTLQDEFLTLLDICGTFRDFMIQIKENAREIQTSLRTRRRRRRTSDTNSFETLVSKNTCFRKKVIKDAKKLFVELRKLESKICSTPILEQNYHVSSVVRSIQEVVTVSAIVFDSVCLFLCAPISKQKTSWAVVSKLLKKGAAVACENQVEDLNELQSLDIALDHLCKSDSGELKGDIKVHEAQTSLKYLEISIEDIEDKLERSFRGLIKVKANLLNISSNIV